MSKTSKPDQLRDAPAAVLAAYNRLNPKQKAFSLLLPTAASQSEAAHLAGYSATTSKKLAFKTAALPDVQVVVGYLTRTVAQEEIGEAWDSLERTVREVCRMALADPRQLFDDEGRLLPIREWPEDAARAVSSIKSYEAYEGRGENRVATGIVQEVKFHPKAAGLDILAKIKGFYRPQQHEHKHTGLGAILEEIDGAETGPGPSH